MNTSLGAASKLLVTGFTSQPGASHETVVRTVGILAVGGGSAVGALGACVVSDIAFAAGIASLPDPVTEISDDLWNMIVPFAATSSADPNHRAYPFDSRAMRKIEEGQTLAFIIANASASSMTFSLYLRSLAKVAVRS